MHPIEVISKVATFRKQQQQLADEKHALLLQLGWSVAFYVNSTLYSKHNPINGTQHNSNCEAALKHEEEWAKAEIKSHPVATEPAPHTPPLTTSYLVATDIVLTPHEDTPYS